MTADTKSIPQIASPASPVSHPFTIKGLWGDEAGFIRVTSAMLARHHVPAQQRGDASRDAEVTKELSASITA